MKKFLGAISTKTLAVIGVALIIIGGGFFALNTKVSSDPLSRVILSISNLKDEFTKTADDFTPGLDLKKMQDKIYKDGISTTEFNLNTTYFSNMGVDKAGIQITASNIPKDLKSEFDLNVSVGNLAAVNAKFTSIGNILYANIPSLYEKAIKLNLQSLGEDLQNEGISKLTGQDFSEYKNLSINLSSTPTTLADLEKDYTKFVSPEFEALKTNASIEKVDIDSKLNDKLKSLGSTKTDLEQFDIKVKSEDVKNLLLKSIDYYDNLQKKQISGIDLGEISSEKNELKESINSAFDTTQVPEFSISAILSKDKLLALSINVEENSKLNLYFAGEKNTTDKVLFESIDNGESMDFLNFAMKTGDENTLDITIIDEELFKYTSTYKNSDKTLSASLVTEDLSLDLEGKYDDVKAGTSYNFVIDKLAISSYDTIDFTGNVKISTEQTNIAAPSESVEVFKASEEELNDIIQAITQNAQANYGPLMMMFLGGGF